MPVPERTERREKPAQHHDPQQRSQSVFVGYGVDDQQVNHGHFDQVQSRVDGVARPERPDNRKSRCGDEPGEQVAVGPDQVKSLPRRDFLVE